MLSKEQFMAALPKSMTGGVTQAVMDSVNNTIKDPYVAEAVRDNIIGFSSVLKNGTYRMDDYLNAVRYVSFKMMGDSNLQAWCKTFPVRHQALLIKGMDAKVISSHVAMYNKNKLVFTIFEQSLVPSHILNADVFQEAINNQAAIMRDVAVSPKVRSDAANSLLTHLKRPEAQKIELDVGIKDSGAIKELKEITMGLAAQQEKLIQSGVYNPKEIAHQALIIEMEPDND